MPRIDGIGAFRGPSQGKRVAVIPTGASATQFVPSIAGQVGDLLVFQRSPAYLIARGDQAYPAWRKRLFRHLPPAMRLHRALIYAKYESRALAFTRLKGIMRFAVEQPFRRMLVRDVPDPALRARLEPDYPIGCKRILLSDDYLATFSRPNVRLVSDAVRRIVPEGVETADGTLHRVEAIIYGTGFAATDFLAPMRVAGRGGLDLNRAWRDGAAAYLGITVPGCPNFFMLYGPNTNLGHNSIVYMLESQVAHIMRCLRAMEQGGATTVEVGAAAHREFNGRLHARLDGAVWKGCSSWYLDQEILHGDALRLAAHAARCGVSCLLEEYEGCWHVFHLQAFYLRSAREAIARLAGFAGECVGPTAPRAQDAAAGTAAALDEAVRP